jgi:hypothetical protein
MNNQLRHECMRVLFNCWHCQKIDDYKKYSHRRLNSSVKNSTTTRNGDDGTDKDRVNLSAASSLRQSPLRSSKKKTSTIPILETDYV